MQDKDPEIPAHFFGTDTIGNMSSNMTNGILANPTKVDDQLRVANVVTRR